MQCELAYEREEFAIDCAVLRVRRYDAVEDHALPFVEVRQSDLIGYD
jgi:hypothetical protein